MEHQSEKQSKGMAQKFLKHFNLEKDGFYDLVPYSDGNIGFSIRKDFKKKSDKTTLLSVYIYEEEKGYYKPIIMHATYGNVVKDGVKIRSKYNNFEPVDINSDDEYFYDILKNEILDKKHKVISANKIITDFYFQHIKSTKIIRGFWLRMKIFFWRSFLKSILEKISKLFYFLNYLISGDQYTFEYLFDKIINADKKYDWNKQEGKPEIEKSEKIEFFGYSIKKWPIIAYSFLHVGIYVWMMSFNFKPVIISTIFKNNFLTIIYVIFSLWIVEGVFPFMFKYLIRLFSKLSYLSHNKSIKI